MTEVEGELPLKLSALFGESARVCQGPLFANELFGDELKCVSFEALFDDNHSLLDSIRKPTWKCGGESVLHKKREEYHASSIELCRVFADEKFTDFCASCKYHPSQKEDADANRAHDYIKLVMLKVAYETIASEAMSSCAIFKRMTTMVKDVVTFCIAQLEGIKEKHGFIISTMPKRYNRRAMWHELNVLTRYKEEYENGFYTPAEYAGLLGWTLGNTVTELRRYCGAAFTNALLMSVHEKYTRILYYHDGEKFRYERNHFLTRLRNGWLAELHVVHRRLFNYAITDGNGHVDEYVTKILLSEIEGAEVRLSHATQSYERQKADTVVEIETLASTYEVIDWMKVSLEQISSLHDEMGSGNRNMYLRTNLRDIQKAFVTALTTLREREVEAVLATEQELEQDFERLCA